jgi:hypothetical protein
VPETITLGYRPRAHQRRVHLDPAARRCAFWHAGSGRTALIVAEAADALVRGARVALLGDRAELAERLQKALQPLPHVQRVGAQFTLGRGEVVVAGPTDRLSGGFNLVALDDTDEIAPERWDTHLWPFLVASAARVLVAGVWSPLVERLAADRRWATDRMDVLGSTVLPSSAVELLREELHPGVFAVRYRLTAPPPPADAAEKAVVLGRDLDAQLHASNCSTLAQFRAAGGVVIALAEEPDEPRPRELGRADAAQTGQGARA